MIFETVGPSDNLDHVAMAFTDLKIVGLPERPDFSTGETGFPEMMQLRDTPDRSRKISDGY